MDMNAWFLSDRRENGVLWPFGSLFDNYDVIRLYWGLKNLGIMQSKNVFFIYMYMQ